MTSELTVEASSDTSGPQKVWGIHNGIVILAAVGLLALSILLELLQRTQVLEGAPVWAFRVLGQVSWALVIGAGAVIGMLVGTRILQAHVSTRGAKLLAVWGVVAIAVGMVSQALLVSTVLQPDQAGTAMRFLSQFLGQLLSSVQVFVNIGAVMIALAFVARLRH